MVFVENTLQKTHYDFLSVKEDANYEEIRAGYRSAILNFHPDKLQRTSDASNPGHDLQDRFLQVQKAWEVLSNPRSRAVYDSKLRALRQETELADDVSLEDMMIEEDNNGLRLFCQCRCGDYFSIDSFELEDMGHLLMRDGNEIFLQTPDALPSSVVLPCGSCSLKVRFLVNSDARLHTDADL